SVSDPTCPCLGAVYISRSPAFYAAENDERQQGHENPAGVHCKRAAGQRLLVGQTFLSALVARQRFRSSSRGASGSKFLRMGWPVSLSRLRCRAHPSTRRALANSRRAGTEARKSGRARRSVSRETSQGVTAAARRVQ